MKCKGVIKDVVVQPDKIQPIILNFPNGTLKDEQAIKMKCGYYSDKRKNDILGVANGQNIYKSYRPSLENEFVYTMLGVYNKKTGNIRLVKAERWQASPVLDVQCDYKNLLNHDKINILNTQFGSKKTRRRAVQIEKMKVSTDAVKDQLEKTASNVEIKKEDLLLPTEVISNVPSCSRDATRPEDVYNLYHIIPKSKFELMSEKIEELQSGESEITSEFYKKSLQSCGGDSEHTKKIVILQFIRKVCKWLNTNIRDAKKKGNSISPIPEISNFIIDTYSIVSASGRTRPISVRDKAVIHCIILALIVHNFKLDLDLFSTNFNSSFGIKKLTELSRIVGAIPSKDNKKIVILKVPLPPPVSTLQRGKKK